MFVLVVECGDGVFRQIGAVTYNTPAEVTMRAIVLVPRELSWGIWDKALGDFVPNNYALN